MPSSHHAISEPRRKRINPSNLDDIVENSIRSQHPEWVKLDGTCPRCASYVYELADELAGHFCQTKNEENENKEPPPPSDRHE